jgi:hypothetical protein|tara:strand:- start:5004 stop:5354 length:351 start_codon:yes stop_codon:yes gene_type:complete
MLDKKKFYDLGDNLNSKIHNQTFCEAVSLNNFEGWKEVGEIYTLKAQGKELGEAKIIAVHECSKEDVCSNSLPSILMSLVSGENSTVWAEKLEGLSSTFYFVLFERVAQLELSLSD